MKIVILALMCYLVGCINPAYIIGRVKGFDIRNFGSLNAGASNVAINVGKRAAAFTAVFDMMKAFFCYKFAIELFPEIPYIGVICAVCCIIGHIYPLFMGFHGGKGFACLWGMIFAFDVRVAISMIIVLAILAFAVRYLCVITTLTSLSFPVIYCLMTKDVVGTLTLFWIGAIIIGKHFPNFKRIRLGTEARMSSLWNREEEEERIRKNLEKLTDEG